MIKIYFDFCTLIIRDNLFVHDNNSEGIHPTKILKEPAEADVISIISNVSDYSGVILIQTQSIENILTIIRKKLTVVLAAGGLVYTPDNSILMIFRRGKWDLPKGKLDEGEDLQTCALREVKEETGVGELFLAEKIMVTYHTYKEKNKMILKESHWYFMKSDTAVNLVPQTEEDIEECRWVSVKDIPAYYSQTHPSIIDVLDKRLQTLNRNA